MRVLVLEDDIFKLIVAEKALRSQIKNDLVIDSVRDLADGLNALAQQSYDLIITDMHYPNHGEDDGTSGLKLCDFVKEKGFKIPIIVFSTGQYSIPGTKSVVYRENYDYESDLRQAVKEMMEAARLSRAI